MRSAPYFLSSSEVLLRLATGTAPQGEKLAEVPSCPGGSPMEEDPRTQLGTLSLRSQRGSFQQNLIKRSWGGKRRLSMGQGPWLWQCSGECCPVGEGGSPPAALLWALGVAFWKGSCTCRQEEQGLRDGRACRLGPVQVLMLAHTRAAEEQGRILLHKQYTKFHFCFPEGKFKFLEESCQPHSPTIPTLPTLSPAQPSQPLMLREWPQGPGLIAGGGSWLLCLACSSLLKHLGKEVKVTQVFGHLHPLGRPGQVPGS